MDNKLDFKLDIDANINDKKIPVDVTLAKALTVNKAMFIQQLYYWMKVNEQKDKMFKDDRYWVRSTLDEWNERDFPFWCRDTLYRVVKELENQGIVISDNYNKIGFDRTKWYSLDLDRLNEIVNQTIQTTKDNQNNAKKDNTNKNIDTEDNIDFDILLENDTSKDESTKDKDDKQEVNNQNKEDGNNKITDISNLSNEEIYKHFNNKNFDYNEVDMDEVFNIVVMVENDKYIQRQEMKKSKDEQRTPDVGYNEFLEGNEHPDFKEMVDYFLKKIGKDYYQINRKSLNKLNSDLYKYDKETIKKAIDRGCDNNKKSNDNNCTIVSYKYITPIIDKIIDEY